jgi:hypothetical protein
MRMQQQQQLANPGTCHVPSTQLGRCDVTKHELLLGSLSWVCRVTDSPTAIKTDPMMTMVIHAALQLVGPLDLLWE